MRARTWRERGRDNERFQPPLGGRDALCDFARRKCGTPWGFGKGVALRSSSPRPSQTLGVPHRRLAVIAFRGATPVEFRLFPILSRESLLTEGDRAGASAKVPEALEALANQASLGCSENWRYDENATREG